MNQPSLLFNYLPIKLQQDSLVSWLHAGAISFTDPFFDETIGKIKRLPENRRRYISVSSTDVLEQGARELDSIKPSAIIFHVSRCGSTLLSQLLGLDATNIMLAEIPFFDDLLRSKYKGTNQDCSNALPYAVQFYGQRRTGNEKHLFIKTDSWHLFFYEQWRNLYPDIPFILLYRRPDEVIHSQMRRKGLHAVPGLIEKEIFELETLPSIADGHENYMAAVLKQYYMQMLFILEKDPLAYSFNYNKGIGNVALKMMSFIGSELDERQAILFEDRLKYDAKDPMKLFSQEAFSSIKSNKYLQEAFELYKKLEVFKTEIKTIKGHLPANAIK